MTIPSLSTANTFGEWVNDTELLISLMNLLTEGPQFNANTLLVLQNANITGNLRIVGSGFAGYGSNSFYHAGNIPIGNTTIQGIIRIIDSISSNSTANAATANAARWAYEHGNSAFAQANSANNLATIAAANANLVAVQVNNVYAGTRKTLNFKTASANVSIAVSDDSSNNSLNISFDSITSVSPRQNTTLKIDSTTIGANSNVFNLFVGPGITISANNNTANGEYEIWFFANNIYDKANSGATAANLKVSKTESDTMNGTMTAYNFRGNTINLGVIGTGTQTLNIAQAEFFLAIIAGNPTWVFTGHPANNSLLSSGFTLVLENGANGTHTFPSGASWSNNSVPVFSANSDAISFVNHGAHANAIWSGIQAWFNRPIRR